jgi:hypothetical protein
VTEEAKVKRSLRVGCSWCGSKPGEPCVFVAADIPAVSVAWSHRAREEAVEARG